MIENIGAIKENIANNLEFQKQMANQMQEEEKAYSFINLLEDADAQIEEWIDSLNMLLDLAKHMDTTGGKVAATFLCSIYNGNRVAFNTGSLCSLDMDYWSDAMNVLKLDRLNMKEIHNYIEDGSKVFEGMIKELKEH